MKEVIDIQCTVSTVKVTVIVKDRRSLTRRSTGEKVRKKCHPGHQEEKLDGTEEDQEEDRRESGEAGFAK